MPEVLAASGGRDSVDSCRSITATSRGCAGRTRGRPCRARGRARRAAGRGHPVGLTSSAPMALVGERLDHVVLAVEVAVEGARAELGAARDLAQREVGSAALEENLPRRSEDLVAGVAMTAFAAAEMSLESPRVTLGMALPMLLVIVHVRLPLRTLYPCVNTVHCSCPVCSSQEQCGVAACHRDRRSWPHATAGGPRPSRGRSLPGWAQTSVPRHDVTSTATRSDRIGCPTRSRTPHRASCR